MQHNEIRTHRYSRNIQTFLRTSSSNTFTCVSRVRCGSTPPPQQQQRLHGIHMCGDEMLRCWCTISTTISYIPICATTKAKLDLIYKVCHLYANQPRHDLALIQLKKRSTSLYTMFNQDSTRVEDHSSLPLNAKHIKRKMCRYSGSS